MHRCLWVLCAVYFFCIFIRFNIPSSGLIEMKVIWLYLLASIVVCIKRYWMVQSCILCDQHSVKCRWKGALNSVEGYPLKLSHLCFSHLYAGQVIVGVRCDEDLSTREEEKFFHTREENILLNLKEDRLWCIYM